MNTRGLFWATKRKPCLPPGDRVPKPSMSTDSPRSSVSRSTRAMRRVIAALERDAFIGTLFSLWSGWPLAAGIVQDGIQPSGQAGRFPSQEDERYAPGVRVGGYRIKFRPIDRRRRRWIFPTPRRGARSEEHTS